MTITLALPKIVSDVTARFQTELPAVQVSFGWREPVRHPTALSRVVFVPGHDRGNLGEVGPARNPGRFPRPIGTLLEAFTVYVGAIDLAGPETELLQYEVARLLFDQTHRAIYKSAYGTFAVVGGEWLIDKEVRRFGCALRVFYTVESALVDSEPISPAGRYLTGVGMIATFETGYEMTIDPEPPIPVPDEDNPPPEGD